MAAKKHEIETQKAGKNTLTMRNNRQRLKWSGKWARAYRKKLAGKNHHLFSMKCFFFRCTQWDKSNANQAANHPAHPQIKCWTKHKRGNATFKLKWKRTSHWQSERGNKPHDFDTLWVSPSYQHTKLKFHFLLVEMPIFCSRFPRFSYPFFVLKHWPSEPKAEFPFIHTVSHKHWENCL